MKQFIIFTACFSFIQSLAELVTPHKKARHWLAGALYLLVGFLFLYIAGSYGSFFTENPQWYGWSVPLVAWCAPLIYYYFTVSLELDVLRVPRLLLELAPGTVIAILLLLFNPGFGSSGEAVIQTDFPAFFVLTLVPAMGYLAFFLLKVGYRLKKATGGLQVVSEMLVPAVKLYLGLLFLILAVASYAVISRTRLFLEITHGLLAVELYLIYLYLRRNPRLLENWLVPIKRAKYMNSHLSSVDLEQVSDRLYKLLDDENIYTDESLSLETLAQKLDLTKHQLSEFFNRHLSTSFANFINNHRVEAAKTLLLRSNQTVLSIGLDVGFASKSAFNRSFRKLTGESPSDFRKRSRKSG